MAHGIRHRLEIMILNKIYLNTLNPKEDSHLNTDNFSTFFFGNNDILMIENIDDKKR